MVDLTLKAGGIRSVTVHLRGTVQGVGFRPFVYRLCRELGLTGEVVNTGEGVVIEAEGPENRVHELLGRLRTDLPPRASIRELQYTLHPPRGYREFTIAASDERTAPIAPIPPDLATCPECLAEILDPHNRRYLYPFTNCTHCGPRFSVIEHLPYDRPNTSMRIFRMCSECEREYCDPDNRRFHAQPNACPNCGPQIKCTNGSGEAVALGDAALNMCAEAIRQGKIVAFKGIGGFQLLVDARNDEAVETLRKRKNRPHKPLAVMFPDMAALRKECSVTQAEEDLLSSPAAPIVLTKRRLSGRIAFSVSPGNAFLGAMLPYSPLHHILMRRLKLPVVATSGNVSEEPICIDNEEAFVRLRHIADYFLIHNRPIVRQADDSVLMVVEERPYTIRRSRGYAPAPLETEQGPVVLAVGAHQKNTVSLSVRDHAIISQHIGDLDNQEAYDVFRRTVESLRQIYDLPLAAVACDEHPDYLSSRYARELGVKVIPVQHHFAHIVSCMTDNRISGDVLGVCWDGTGYGLDGTVWGGEFLKADLSDFERVGTFRRFPLPGGELAVKEPRRSALGLLFALYEGDEESVRRFPCLKTFTAQELKIIYRMLTNRLNTPLTSSVGRLFDAVAALLDLHDKISFEGQAAMTLEYLAMKSRTKKTYPAPFLAPSDKGPWEIDWAPMVRQILAEIGPEHSFAEIAAAFHNTLIEVIVQAARKSAIPRVVLSGGCFQNRYLLEGAIARLRAEGFEPFWHRDVPANDGGISLGQAAVAVRRMR